MTAPTALPARALGQQRSVAEVLALLDSNRDGRLTQAEVPSDMWPRISRADSNGDGAVTPGELAAARAKVRTYRAAPALLLALVLGGCAASSSPVAPTTASPLPVSSTATVDPDLVGILTADIQDEYQAAAIYEGVLLDFGAGTRPFSNIVPAEQQHARSVAALFTACGLPVPASRFSAANVPRFSTLREACAAAVRAKIANVALYDSQLGASLPEDVTRVLRANRDASFYNHLPAFQLCQ